MQHEQYKKEPSLSLQVSNFLLIYSIRASKVIIKKYNQNQKQLLLHFRLS